MTIEKIKEWWSSNRFEPIVAYQAIDTLLAEVERLNDCKGCDAPRQLAVATEALEIIAGERTCVDNSLGNTEIASLALERMKG